MFAPKAPDLIHKSFFIMFFIQLVQLHQWWQLDCLRAKPSPGSHHPTKFCDRKFSESGDIKLLRDLARPLDRKFK